MSWLEKIMPAQIGAKTAPTPKKAVPEGLWAKCNACGSMLYRAELERSLEVCPKCGAHRAIPARRRLDAFLDADDREEIAGDVESVDPLKFRDSKRYRDRLVAGTKASGERDALVVMKGSLLSAPVVAAAFEFSFMAGSMGSAVGERFVRGVDACIAEERALISFTASGGARMQEALFSLFQMAKTSAALARLSDRGLPFISVMTNPTTGGVSASLAMLGDVNLAEPGALIGFAGPRVIEQTVRQKLPEGFQTAEFLLEHGHIDGIIDRRQMRPRLGSLLSILMQRPAPDAKTT